VAAAGIATSEPPEAVLACGIRKWKREISVFKFGRELGFINKLLVLPPIISPCTP